jgi:ubiquinone/menaquinone biosynthesis C-methylase UbiE
MPHARLLPRMIRIPGSEAARTTHWLFSRRGPAFLNGLIRLGDDSLHRIAPYLKTGQVAVDLGCGWGRFSLELAYQVGPTGTVYAVDLASKCVNALQDKARKQAVHNLVARRASAADLHFIPDCSVDLVFANGLLCSMATDRAAAVAEMKRVLKPTGHAYLSLGATPPLGYVDEPEWNDILSGFDVVEGGDYRHRWAIVARRTPTEE